MSLLNRYYVMKQVLGRKRFSDYLKLILWMAFSHLSVLAQSDGWRALAARLRGECRALAAILSHKGFHTS